MNTTIHGRRYDTGEPVAVTIAGEQITSIEPAHPRGRVDAWPYLAPAMFDLQINGHGGTWFSKVGLTADEVIAALEPHFQYGITRLCPTLITSSYEALASGFAAIREACERDEWVSKMVPGCHLEGPYLSAEDGPRGAHPREHIRPADWNEFSRWQDISGGRIRLVTIAPESEGAIEFIKKATAAGVVISIGHTAANTEQIAAAVDAGAKLSTHLGNGAHGTLRRHPNYIWDQLGEPRLMASIITDGHHLPASVIRSIVAAKTPARTIITCDAAGLAGCPPGRYRHDSVEVEVLEGGPIVIAGQRQLLSGSGVQTDVCVAKILEFTKVSLAEALDMAGRNPAKLLGFDAIRLERGSRADLIQFDFDGPGSALKMRCTFAAGDVRFGTPWTED